MDEEGLEEKHEHAIEHAHPKDDAVGIGLGDFNHRGDPVVDGGVEILNRPRTTQNIRLAGMSRVCVYIIRLALMLPSVYCMFTVEINDYKKIMDNKLG